MTEAPHLRGRAFAVTFLLLAIAACTNGGPPDRTAGCPNPQGVVSVGERIPADCVLERLEGGTLRIGDLIGKPAVINFWAAWCTFCIAEMPDFEKAHKALGDRLAIVGADLLGIDGETRAAAKTFAARTGVTYPLVYDAEGLLYGHFSPKLIMPVTIFVKADGVVAHRQFGPLTEKRIREIARAKLRVG